jgi:hypothetical protein
MYTRLTVKWSNTLFGCIAAVMAPIPIILLIWGPKIRARSKFAKMLELSREQQATIGGGGEKKTTTLGIDIDIEAAGSSRGNGAREASVRSGNTGHYSIHIHLESTDLTMIRVSRNSAELLGPSFDMSLFDTLP